MSRGRKERNIRFPQHRGMPFSCPLRAIQDWPSCTLHRPGHTVLNVSVLHMHRQFHTSETSHAGQTAVWQIHKGKGGVKKDSAKELQGPSGQKGLERRSSNGYATLPNPHPLHPRANNQPTKQDGDPFNRSQYPTVVIHQAEYPSAPCDLQMPFQPLPQIKRQWLDQSHVLVPLPAVYFHMCGNTSVSPNTHFKVTPTAPYK